MSEELTPDTLYSKKLTDISHFSFNDDVVSVFPDMIKRSVPGYNTILGMISDLASRYVQADSNCYDLGCSLGAASLAMRNGINSSGCHIIGIDNSKAMISRCQSIINTSADQNSLSATPVSLHCNNIEDAVIENASMVVLNFTLQFIPLEQRLALLQRIYDGLLPNGILLLSEKVVFDDKPHQQLMTELYHNFKRSNGYSDLEIAQKRTALEEVLRPETLESHKERLKTIGFNSADTWFQCMTFASLLAIKS